MVSEQALPPGIYLVATPIGNLQDITLRALDVLKRADRIACEDTRQTQKLLHHFGIDTPTISYHLHNEKSRAEELVAQAKEGARIAVVSDAGMPGIADPGAEMVQAAISAGVVVFPVPGANAALSALVASGLDTERFAFLGFLPSKPGERKTALEELRTAMLTGHDGQSAFATRVMYETPHRIVDALADMEAVFGPQHRVVLARELTKLHEEFLRGTVSEVRNELLKREIVRGEMVLMLSGEISAETAPKQSLADAVRAAIAEGLDENSALKRVAKQRSIGKSEAYREWQRHKHK